ncbi:piggyBac transposable element-derived protein 3, partial [Biomphalaria pfeifferi]
PKGYNDVDEGPPAPTPKFRPAREPGVHLNDEILTKAGVRKFLHPSDFFKLYFTVDLVNMLVLYTNKYAAHFGPTKPTVYKGCYELLKDLLLKGICACGTILKNRKGFPNALKDVKTFEKNSNRGDMRWVRDDEILTTQWRDNKTVSVMSNFMTANGYSFVKRRTKINGEYRELLVKQPSIIKEYNVYMGGVDKSDQLINKYNVLRKTKKYWKTLFFHFIDIARVNSYILFQEWRKTHSDIPELKRPNRYLQLDFTEELTRELGKIEKYQSVPTASNVKQSKKTTYSIIPEFSQTRRNCKLCYQTLGVERKVSTKCGECDTYLCFHGKSNCLLKYHQSYFFTYQFVICA